MDDFYILRPIISENCNVTLAELDTIYNFLGLSELHMLLDVKMNFMDLEERRMTDKMNKSDV